MIYYTGDIHGAPREIVAFCNGKELTEQDTLILLGDVGANYFLSRRDTELKKISCDGIRRNRETGKGAVRSPCGWAGRGAVGIGW